MASDVSIRYGVDRLVEPLTDTERTRLRQLTSQRRRSPAEQYELGALRGRARHDRTSVGLLDDLGHEQAGRSQPVTTRRANSMVAKAVRDAIDRRLAEGDD
jgi:hypothetical protein